MYRLKIVFLLITALATTTAIAENNDKAEAKALFKKGVTLAKQESYREAIAAFKESLDRYPTKNALFNLGNAYRMDNQYLAAIDTFTRLTEEYGDNLKKEMEIAVRKHLEELQELLATLCVTVDQPGATILINGEEKALLEQESIQLEPGDYELAVYLDGYNTEKRNIRLVSGATRTEAISLTPVQEAPAPMPAPVEPTPVLAETPAKEPAILPETPKKESKTLAVLAWTSVGLTAATGIATGIFWGLSSLRADDFETQDNKIANGEFARYDADIINKRDDAYDDAKLYGLLTIGFGAVTAVFAATTGTLFVLKYKKSKSMETARIGFRPGGIGGSF